MNFLYSATEKITLEEYKKFNLRLAKKHFISYCSFELFFILIAILLKSTYFTIVSVVYPIVIIALMIWWIKYSIKKNFESHKSLLNTEATHEFYDTYFISKSYMGETKLPYDKLYRIIETKTNFYFMLSKHQGIIIDKNSLPSDFEGFARELITKYNLK